MSITASVAHNLWRLAQFTGRSTLAQFWPYTLCVVGLFAAAMLAAVIPTVLLTLRRMQAFAAAHPDQATAVSGPGTYSITIHGNHPELMPDLTGVVDATSVLALLSVAALAAAVTRRLHDRDRSGRWGLLPLPFLFFSMTQMRTVLVGFRQEQPDLIRFFAVFLSNAAYLAALAYLVSLLVTRATPGGNRFGLEDRS